MSHQPHRMREINLLIQLTKAASLERDLFPEDKIEKSNDKILYPIADGLKLQRNYTILQASEGIAEVISLTLLISRDIALSMACNLASTYLYDKMEKHKDKVAGLLVRRKRTKNNPHDIAQAFLQEIEELEKDENKL